MPNVDYLCFDSMGFILLAIDLQFNGEKIQVTQKVFSTLVVYGKSSCSSFLFSTMFCNHICNILPLFIACSLH
jgi:hypothetical protein